MTLSLLNLTLINIHITQQERAKNLEPKEVYLSQLQYKDKSNVACSVNNCTRGVMVPTPESESESDFHHFSEIFYSDFNSDSS